MCKKLVFNCRECGSNKLAYHKYAKCITPAKLQEYNNIEYGLSRIDEDDYICCDNCFICLNCEGFVEHRGFRMETEKDLLDYLTMDPAIRKQEQKEYEEHLIAQAHEQEQNEQIHMDEIAEENTCSKK